MLFSKSIGFTYFLCARGVGKGGNARTPRKVAPPAQHPHHRLAQPNPSQLSPFRETAKMQERKRRQTGHDRCEVDSGNESAPPQ